MALSEQFLNGFMLGLVTTGVVLVILALLLMKHR